MSKRKKYRIDADKLKSARKWADLSVEELSEKASAIYAETAPGKNGFSISDIQKYEKGDAYIYADKLKILSSILEVRPESILFFDTPEPLSDTVQFKTWSRFVNNIFTYNDRYWGLVSYSNYMTFLFDCCSPRWEALSSLGGCGTKEPSARTTKQQDVIYTSTRKNGLRKTDFISTREILVLLTHTRDEAMLRITEDRHVAEQFKRMVLKHQEVLHVVKELVEAGEVQYSLSDLERLISYFEVLSKSLAYAKFCALGERAEQSLDDYGGSDQAAHHEDIYQQVMYSELDTL